MDIHGHEIDTLNLSLFFRCFDRGVGAIPQAQKRGLKS